ncbi:MAG: ABC transporter substrate-binding protein, partial [Lapillicoccus sp.]
MATPRGGRRGPWRLIGTGALVALVLAACTTAPGRPTAVTPGRGGTLRVLLDTPVAHWDPQRMDGGPEAQFAVRTFLRTLTTQAPAGVGLSPGLIPDLATDTGRESDGGRTWTFTLRSTAMWQDDHTVTCADVKYGVSRNFAHDTLRGGLPYAASLLDIPLVKAARGDVSAYSGPYTGTGQALYDQAVTCQGQVLTFHLKVPVHDFNQAVSLPAFAPVRQDQDKGGASNFSVFSCGPYLLEGTWDPGNGGRFVRNRSWLAATDSIRLANPDVIDVREGLETTTAIQRIIDDVGQDRFAVTWADAPPALQQQLMASPELVARVTNPAAPNVEYLVPNFKSPVMSTPAVRQALAMATNRDAFVAAYGGTTAMTPTSAVLASTVPGHQDVNPFGVGTQGDAARARAVLVAAQVSLPVPIRVAYRQSTTADAAFAALRVGWEKAGFAVTLKPIVGNYYATISSPQAARDYDVFRASWRADWPSGSTVIPTNFDARVNVTASGPGQDYGYFADATVDAAIDAASAMANDTARNAAWGAIDEQIARLGGHIALA